MRISDKFGIPHISTGAFFRDQLERNTDLGQRIRKYMETGSLVPDELTCEVVEDRLKQDDCRAGYVLDGFPRSLPQARILDQMLAKRGERLDLAIDLEVPDDEIVNRLTARRMCPVCGKIYNLKFNPPASDGGICDRPACTGQLVTRSDDREETVRARLGIYHEMTAPIIEYYTGHRLLRSVEGDSLGPDGVFKRVESILSGLKRV